MINNKEYTPVQNLFKTYLSLIDEENDFNDELEDLENAFNEIIISEKEILKQFFVAGMFAKDKIKDPNFDLDNYFDKFYYTTFPDE